MNIYIENDSIFLQGQNRAIKVPFRELAQAIIMRLLSYNEGCVAKSPCIVCNSFPHKVSVDIMNVTATLELQAVKNIAV